MASIQPCLRKMHVNLGYYDAKEKYPGTKNKKGIGLYLHNNHFYLI